MALLLQQLNLNRDSSHAPTEVRSSAISLNPSDIFSAMKKNEQNAAMGLPPLPTKNAFKLEDLENL